MATRDHAHLSPAQRTDRVKKRALELGFQNCGVCDLSPTPHGDALSQWLRAGMAGTMGYMHRQESRRREPHRIVDGATHAVVVTWNYYSSEPEWSEGKGRIASYARGTDYHQTLRDPLERLADLIRQLGNETTITKVFVDAGPVPERELAQRAGIGWIGKNTMLLDPRHGSFFFIASILTNLELATDEPFDADRCGTCRRCLDACPTGAFPHERVLDSRLCISYLTIEHDGPIDESIGQHFNGWLFGCDDCQTVCPWNVKFARATDAEAPDPGALPAGIDLEELSRMTDADFDERFGGTPLTRSGANRIREIARLLEQNANRSRELR